MWIFIRASCEKIIPILDRLAVSTSFTENVTVCAKEAVCLEPVGKLLSVVGQAVLVAATNPDGMQGMLGSQ